MNKNNALRSSNSKRRSFSIRGLAMAAVISVCGMAATGMVCAQSTVGKVFGKAPAGDTVTAISMTSGLQRQDQADAKGRYSIANLPAGTYTVTLMENDQPVVKHVNVPVMVGRGVKVDFDCVQGQCGELANKP